MNTYEGCERLLRGLSGEELTKIYDGAMAQFWADDTISEEAKEWMIPKIVGAVWMERYRRAGEEAERWI